MKKIKNKNVFDATKSSINGIHELIKEPAIIRELFIIAWGVFGYFIYNINDAITLSIIAVLIVCFEAVNTAIENICDYINPEYSRRIKIINDLSAAPIFLLISTFVIFNVYLIVR